MFQFLFQAVQRFLPRAFVDARDHVLCEIENAVEITARHVEEQPKVGWDVPRGYQTCATGAASSMCPIRSRRTRDGGRLIRIMVPVNLRGSDDSENSGNHISLVPVTLPLDIRSPKRLLAAVHKKTEFLKRAHAAELVSLVGGLIGVFPGPMQALAGPMISQVPFTPFNMVCTSVPGPQFPLYLLGHKMLRWYPYVPIGGEMAVNCAILSYDGMVYFGFSGDVHAAPDLWRLEKFVKQSFVELRDASRPPAPRKKAERKKPARTRKPVSKSAEPAATTVRAPIPLTAVRSCIRINSSTGNNGCKGESSGPTNRLEICSGV